MNKPEKFGALVISLDFEIHWGVRDYESTDGNYRQNLLGGREAVLAMLEIFEEFGVAATWATVGFLFAKSKSDLEKYKPEKLPEYRNATLFPYDEKVGENEAEDVFHYAPSLIEKIKNTPRQEIGTHTYSHYYCLDLGQTAETFAADLRSAARIAEDYGITHKSIVFPRNQHNPAYEDILLENGITCFRGNQKSWAYQISETNRKNPAFRIARLLDTYVNLSGHNTIKWEEVRQNKVGNIPASFFLRPFSKKVKSFENLRIKRIKQSIRYAAKSKEIVHIWWHPHNFGVNLKENIEILRKILETFRECRENHGMQSLSMNETIEKAREAAE